MTTVLHGRPEPEEQPGVEGTQVQPSEGPSFTPGFQQGPLTHMAPFLLPASKPFPWYVHIEAAGKSPLN